MNFCKLHELTEINTIEKRFDDCRVLAILVQLTIAVNAQLSYSSLESI
jgi:hypothetical protein